MIARELTPDRLASAASRLGAASAAAAAAAASGLHQGHAAAAGAGDSADGDSAHGLGHAQTLGMAEAYEHFWGLDETMAQFAFPLTSHLQQLEQSLSSGVIS